jgi:SAM-dependent methyltransferase
MTEVAVHIQTRKVLNVGSGPDSPTRVHAMFRADGWQQTRLDVDESARPDILCSVTDMRGSVESASFDALWSSHVVEHLHGHEVELAFAEFARVLKPDGYALVRCPDLDAIARAILSHGAEHVAYVAPAGPITPLDMLYGHGQSIARGDMFMRHHTGFNDRRLGRLLVAVGFDEVRTKSSGEFDLWAMACMPEADVARVLSEIGQYGLAFDI